MSACIDRPISWLELERYDLGEVAPAEHARIEAHLRACAACRACHEEITAGAVRELPPLPARVSVLSRRTIGARVFALGGGLALAALVLLGVRFGGAPTVVTTGGGGAVKGGGDVVLSLVREGDTAWASEAGVFKSGDRFKALVTCPPSLAASWDLVVIDPSGASLPLDPPPGRVACGNEVPLPGAFRLTGLGAVEICLVWSEGGSLDRNALALGGASALDHVPHTCQRLEATP